MTNVVAGRFAASGGRNALHGAEPLHSSGGGGTYDGMDPWQASVETRLGQLHGSVDALGGKLDVSTDRLSDRIDSNFKWLIGAIGGSFVVTGGMIITSYLMLADKIDALVR